MIISSLIGRNNDQKHLTSLKTGGQCLVRVNSYTTEACWLAVEIRQENRETMRWFGEKAAFYASIFVISRRDPAALAIGSVVLQHQHRHQHRHHRIAEGESAPRSAAAMIPPLARLPDRRSIWAH